MNTVTIRQALTQNLIYSLIKGFLGTTYYLYPFFLDEETVTNSLSSLLKVLSVSQPDSAGCL